MLIEKNLSGKEKSKYKCDRCNTITTDIYSIYISCNNHKTPKKKWDLCRKCYSALERGINKNIKEKNNGNSKIRK